MSVLFGVQDFTDLVLDIAVDLIGGGRGCVHSRKGSGVDGSNWEMWKTGCTEWNWLGRQRVNECKPGIVMIS